MRPRFIGLFVALGLGFGGVAAADDDTEAKAHYQAAEKAMSEGKYDVAAEEYGAAFELKKDPILFVKIGNAQLAADNCKAAVVYFKRYLKEMPADKLSESSRNDTEAKIEKCEGTEAAGTETDTGTGTETESGTGTSTGTGSETGEIGEIGEAGPSFLDEKPSWKRSAGWISLGATVVLGTAGAILAMSGNSREEDLQSLADFRDQNQNPAAYEGNVRSRYEQLVDEGERFNTYSTVALGAAGVTLAVGVTLLILDSTSSHHAESDTAIGHLAPTVDRHGGGLAARFHF